MGVRIRKRLLLQVHGLRVGDWTLCSEQRERLRVVCGYMGKQDILISDGRGTIGGRRGSSTLGIEYKQTRPRIAQNVDVPRGYVRDECLFAFYSFRRWRRADWCVSELCSI